MTSSHSEGPIKAEVVYAPSITRMTSLGLLDESDRWAEASEKLYSLILKSLIENYRADPAVSGYEWWLGFDYFAASNGIVGGHANNPQPKFGISNATIRSVQAEVVLLVEDPVALQSTGRRAGDFVPIEIQLCNWTFGGYPEWVENDAQLSWATSVVGGPALQNGTSRISDISVAQGTTGPVAVFGVDVPQVTKASKVLVEATLFVSGTLVASNRWTLAVFPPAAAKRQCPVAVFAASPSMLDAAQQVCANAVPLPPSLVAQTAPFVVLYHGGLAEPVAAAVQRTSGFAVLLNPAEMGSWPVCGQSALGTVKLLRSNCFGVIDDTVSFQQPWWLCSGVAGTLVYNTSLTEALGMATEDAFLDYSWGSVVDGARGYTLDMVTAGSGSSTVHVRAIPSDGSYGATGYESNISNSALLWEGRIPAARQQSTGGGRFLVSGLNIFSADNTMLRNEPAAEHVFGQLLSYAVSEIASSAIPDDPVPVSAPSTTVSLCNVSGSFCPAGSETPCQTNTASSAVCGGNFEIVLPVCLQQDSIIDALHAKLQARSEGSRAVAAIYELDAAPGANSTFCSTSSPSAPLRRLVAQSNMTTLESGSAAWARLPLPRVPLKAGVYWIGLLFEHDTTCFAPGSPSGRLPPVGPAAADSYAARPWSSGPGSGPELDWVAGSQGFAVYASTVPVL